MDTKLIDKYTDRILWIDLEMTGLEADNDVILEVAVIATDWDFNEVATYEGIIKNEDMVLDERLGLNAIFWDANPVPLENLLAQNQQGKSLSEIQDELLEFINKNFEDNKPVILAGNSVHIDRRFILSQWPQLDNRLHYRMLDVSAWKVVFEGKFKQKFVKANDHRALEDIRESISELKYYLKNVKI